MSGAGSAFLPGGFAIYDSSSGGGYRFSISSTGKALIGGPSFSNDVSGSLLGVKDNVSIGSTYYAIAAPSGGAIIEGNVGIGTAVPAEKLQIIGHISLGSNYTITQDSQMGRGFWAVAGPNTGSSGYSYGMQLGRINPAGGGRYNLQLTAPDTADIAFTRYTAGAFPTAQSGFTYSILIRGDTGNVGIGTTEPSYRLHITDSSTTRGINVSNTTASSYGIYSVGTSYGVYGSDGTTSGYLGYNDQYGLYTANNAYVGGTLTLGGNLTTTGHLLPSADNIYDLGSPTARWQDLYLGPSSLNIYNQASATDYDAITLGYQSNIATLHSTAAGTGTVRPIQIKTGTNVSIYMDTDGNVGIGTANPDYPLHIPARGESAGIMLGSGGRIYEDEDGALHIENQNPYGASLYLASYAQFFGGLFVTSVNNFGSLYIGNNITSEVHIGSYDTPTKIYNYLYIGSAENANSNLEFNESGTRKWHLYNDNTNDRLYVVDDDDNNGVYIAQDATSWTANSDIRLKENLAPLGSVLDKLDNFQIVKYNFIGSPRTEIGVVAQELNQAFPELVDKDSQYWGVTYDRLGVVALQAIKEQQQQIKELQIQLDQLASLGLTSSFGDLDDQETESENTQRQQKTTDQTGPLNLIQSEVTFNHATIATLDVTSRLKAVVVEVTEKITAQIGEFVSLVVDQLKAKVATIAQIISDKIDTLSLTAEKAEVKDLRVNALAVGEDSDTAGSGVIKAGEGSTTIKTLAITERSRIYITFTSDYSPATRFWIAEKIPPVEGQDPSGYFVVELDAPVETDATFDWWVVN